MILEADNMAMPAQLAHEHDLALKGFYDRGIVIRNRCVVITFVPKRLYLTLILWQTDPFQRCIIRFTKFFSLDAIDFPVTSFPNEFLQLPQAPKWLEGHQTFRKVSHPSNLPNISIFVILYYYISYLYVNNLV